MQHNIAKVPAEMTKIVLIGSFCFLVLSIVRQIVDATMMPSPLHLQTPVIRLRTESSKVNNTMLMCFTNHDELLFISLLLQGPKPFFDFLT